MRSSVETACLARVSKSRASPRCRGCSSGPIVATTKMSVGTSSTGRVSATSPSTSSAGGRSSITAGRWRRSVLVPTAAERSSEGAPTPLGERQRRIWLLLESRSCQRSC